MKRQRDSEPPPDPGPTPAIDHLFDGAADPAEPHGDRPGDVDQRAPDEGRA